MFFDWIKRLFASQKKPRRTLNVKRATRWGLIAHSMVKLQRPDNIGLNCEHCQYFVMVSGDTSGICYYFTKGKMFLSVSAETEMPCLQLPIKLFFCLFNARIREKGSRNEHGNNEKKTQKNEINFVAGDNKKTSKNAKKEVA